MYTERLFHLSLLPDYKLLEEKNVVGFIFIFSATSTGLGIYYVLKIDCLTALNPRNLFKQSFNLENMQQF